MAADGGRTAGVIGLGAMGFQMARHMLAKGYRVFGLDVAAAANARAKDIGVTIVDTPAALAARTDILIAMVATDAQVEEAVVASGLLDRLPRGAVVCVAASGAVETARGLAARGAETGVFILDTPVVLGQEAADNGTLTVFCGGDAAGFEKARPALQCFGANVLHVGAPGMGQLTKTVNNMLLWACISANFEALTLAKTMGADTPKMIAALAHSSGANWSLSRWGKSTGKWAEKDMDVALELAQDMKVAMPLAALVDQLMKGVNQEKMRALLA